MPRPDRHNEVEVNFLPSGSLTYLLGGTRITVEAGRLTLFWAAIPHQIVEWETTKPYYVATLPLAWFLKCGFPEHFAQPILAGQIVFDPQTAPGDSAKFRQWVKDLRCRTPGNEQAAQLEIQARLLRLALTLPTRQSDAAHPPQAALPAGCQLSRADQLACYIARHYHEPMTASQIASAAGLHPNYAMMLFRKAFGATITDFLTRHRISHAQRLLVTTDDPVIQIAASSGFQSLSRFNEAFKLACGCPPRSFRNAHRSGTLNA